MQRAIPAVDVTATRLCGLELARMMSAQNDLTIAQAYNALGEIPENMLDLLNHPEGWTALSVFILQGLGVTACPSIVTVH